ncbi:MAG TPA: ABC transporter permease [Candidatus Thermoplasmatota archaeon]|nr:ABC transporter permease [Candidatus Thermoplasmatota archaeon]
MSLVAITQKELADLVREKRFGGWALVFLAFWMLFLFFFISNLDARGSFGTSSVPMLLEPAYFFYAIGFAVLALFVLTDGITKERESGMLPVVAAKPIVRWHIVLAKLLTGVVVYVASYVVTLAPALVLTAAIGLPALEMLTLFYLGPFLALYVFLLGVGLLLGVVTSSSKVAIGTAAGLLLPLFLFMGDGPLSLLYGRYPFLRDVASYTPFQAGYDAAQVLVHGGQMPWGPLLVTAGIGGVCALAAFWAFSRQEVAA